MISVITGSDGIGKYLENANNDVIKVVQGVESMNSAAVYPQLKGMDFLNTFIRSVEGVEGHQEGFREYQVFASDDGSYADAESYKESYATWTFNRRGYVVKDKDFTHEMLKMAYEENKSLSKIVDERISAIADMYLNRYLPNVAYETLFVVPEEGGTYYGTPVGFLRGTVVSPSMLKPYAQSAEHLVRNHYRTIANGTTGVTADDISDVVDFMSEYRNVTDGNIVAIGNRRAIGKLKNTILFDGNRDVFNRTGQPADPIAGVLFIQNDFMPKDWLLFINADADELITRLVSPKEDLRGMAIENERGFQKLDGIEDLVGSHFRIQPEGYHLTGRHQGCFLYIGKDVGSPVSEEKAGRTTRVCSEEELRLLSAHGFQLRTAWHRGLR